MNNSNASDASMSLSSYPPSNYSSGYGSQGSYDNNYNPYGTPQPNMYPYDPYGNYGSGMNNVNPQNNYNYNNYGYNQNDYWQNQNYYNQNYNQNYNYDNNYYQSGYNDPRYANQSNPYDKNWNQNTHPQPQQQQPMHGHGHQQYEQQQSLQTNPNQDMKSQEIVDLDTKEIKLEVRKGEEIPIKEETESKSIVKSEEAIVNEEISNLKLDEIKPEEPDKDMLVKLMTSPTKDDGIYIIIFRSFISGRTNETIKKC